jgi:hypothetical protein
MQQFITITLAAVLFWHCQSAPKTQTATASTDVVAMARQTHKEAIDTLRADTNAPLQPLVIKPLDKTAAQTLLSAYDLKTLLVKEWPDNGFYGTDRYRIEFIFTDAERTINDPSVYRIKGKNRYKNTVSDFAGLIEITGVSEFIDPNLDSLDLANMGLKNAYTLSGTFRFDEDSTLNTSGAFLGTFKLDFSVNDKGEAESWYFSTDTPTKAAGYVFDGNWGSYKNKTTTKPVLFARDLFAIANDILTDFSYGEREVEINKKYRHLGWDNFWDGKEWWVETPAQ